VCLHLTFKAKQGTARKLIEDFGCAVETWSERTSPGIPRDAGRGTPPGPPRARRRRWAQIAEQIIRQERCVLVLGSYTAGSSAGGRAIMELAAAGSGAAGGSSAAAGAYAAGSTGTFNVSAAGWSAAGSGLGAPSKIPATLAAAFVNPSSTASVAGAGVSADAGSKASASGAGVPARVHEM
jgi:hypothetical protein